jgi:hypothetical protein
MLADVNAAEGEKLTNELGGKYVPLPIWTSLNNY